MCLVLIGWRAHPDYRLIVAANRDEYYIRPTESMRRWPEVSGLLAGRDIGARDRAPGRPPGTWLGLRASAGRFATVTNVRNPLDDRADARSRGALLMDFLTDAEPLPERYVRDIASASDDYNGYNLIVSDLETLWWHSNRAGDRPRPLSAGFHGLSNAPFVTSSRLGPDTGLEARAWPKVRAGMAALRKVVESEPDSVERYFDALSDSTQAPDELLPNTGVPHEMERALSAGFIASTEHGTRASTVLLVREDGAYEIAERSFGPLGKPLGETGFRGLLRST
ncbi:NRDE family protein [Nocardia bovistercoris]|uniref:NRDE family protein n=1 Tax=Nocardia bovistercoris TaxID=2785916 RepID=A0A931IFR0_9NOCA|nr:NRDE family protein [Nocardia bovistercoris]MBH0778863.1 NRDE family protein [Nocardia bovistercoris]